MDPTDADLIEQADLELALDETVTTPGGRRVRVTAKAYGCLPRVREHLIGLARLGATTTYGELVRDLELPYPSVGVGRLLDLVAVDCERRAEPGLDAIVLGASHPHDLGITRAHRYWRG